MKRNPILVLGLGVLLSFGVFAVGCGDDAAPKKNDGSVDAKRDSGSTGGSMSTGGAKGTGGVTTNGGATGSGGAVGGATGSGGAVGGATGSGGAVGGATGSGGAIGLDGGVDLGRDLGQTEASKQDVTPDQPINTDVSGEAGTVKLDTHGIDVAPVSLDVAIDQGVDAPPAVDTGSVDGGIDGGGLDGSLD